MIFSTRSLLLGSVVVFWATLSGAPAAGAAAAPAVPAASTGAAIGVSYQSASLTGAINPKGQPTTYFFQYGPTSKYGAQSTPGVLPGGGAAVAVNTPIAGLVPAAAYHYRLVAVNAAGSALGADHGFRTSAIPLSLGIGALPSPVLDGAPLAVAGTLTGTGAGGQAVALQANPFPFTAGFQPVGNMELTSPTGGFQFNLLGLPVTTQFRVVTGTAGKVVVVSPVATELVALRVTMRVTRRKAGRGVYTVRFAGLISPAEDGARVAVERLVGATWRLMAATNARPSSAGRSSYTKTVRLRHGGYFRVFVTPVEGGHIANASQGLLIRLAAR